MSGGTRVKTAPAVNAEQAGRRVEEVIDRLAATGDGTATAAAEELVRSLMEFYGAGLARIMALLDGRAAKSAGTAGSGDEALARLLGDELVAGLLVLHDLHPEDTATRIARALATVPEHAVEVAGFDDATGALSLRSSGGSGSGCGCAATAGAAQQAVEDALACFAPEVKSVHIQPPADTSEPVLLQIGSAPLSGPGPTGPGTRADAAARPAPAKAP
ncbi:hypothetical protein AS594_32650 [Streptomyces agglomeratus]|uniref:NIF system FeS cluster assembly NifU C-terminal domain-containing protein n=1 Tax=Streptomyces agglomeratus TaxID=285458 RepID=A0A1E5PGA5_9ACTN|nr:hypothetical protein [Streptomyces agglomeratus]OEJ28525.1 hypothetical protein AS594_32650 [Streptomyces agglomeratus]